MQYPTIATDQVVDLARTFLEGGSASVDAVATWQGDGPTIDFRDLDDVLNATEDDLRQLLADGNPSSDREPFEGRLAANVYPHLASLPPEVLDDRGFWRYLAVSRFWWFIAWREQEPLAKGNIKSWVDANLPAEQVPLRLYLRAQAVNGDAFLCQAIPKSTDFWRSHVVRVRVGSAPNLARAFAQMQAESRLATPELREYAKRLNRTWTNVVLSLYDAEDSADLVEDLRP